MAPNVRSVEALDGYVVRVVFVDSEVRDVDLEPVLSGPVFGPLRDREVFEQVRVDETGDTITWPTGADLDPDVIYGSSQSDWAPPVRVTTPQRA